MKEIKENQKSGKGWREDKQEILTENGIERKAPIHRKVQMKERYSNTLREPFAEPEELPEIIEEVQSKRKPSAIARDNSKTAESVGDKEDPEDLVEWIREPSKSDLKGVDDESNNPENEESEEE